MTLSSWMIPKAKGLNVADTVSVEMHNLCVLEKHCLLQVSSTLGTLPLSTQARGFKPGRSCHDFSGRKKSSARLPSEFAACKNP